MHMRWKVMAGAVVASAVVLGTDLGAQWPAGSVALRTNGAIMRSGDCLRVEAVALDYVSGPFVPHLRYSFTDTAPASDERSKGPQQRPAVVDRPDGPVIDALEPSQTVLLDDTFCFGFASSPGRYEVEVRLQGPGSSAALGVLRTCVILDDGSELAGRVDCGLMLRGVTRVDQGGSVVFDGDFPGGGPYRAVIFRNHAFDRLIDAGVYQTGPHELVINAPGVWTAGPPSLDLVLVDTLTGRSTSLSRLAVPTVR